MKRKIVAASAAALMGLSASGCVSSGPKETAGAVFGASGGAVAGGLIGGALGGSRGTVAGAILGGAVGGITGSAIGRDLDEQDQRIALAAQTEAFQTGRRKPWRGAHGAYGYVEPEPEFVDARGTCRNFTHRIYVNDRPAVSTGVACLQPEGYWQIVG